MNEDIAVQFSRWLAADQPALFVELYKRAMSGTPLGDFTDLLSSIGTSIGNAASSVGSYLSSSQGLQSLTQLGSSYLQSQAAKNAVNLNLARAQQGLGPAPIQTVYNPTSGQYEAVLNQGGGMQVPISSSLQKTLLPGIPNWMLFAGGGVLLLFLLLTLRR